MAVTLGMAMLIAKGRSLYKRNKIGKLRTNLITMVKMDRYESLCLYEETSIQIAHTLTYEWQKESATKSVILL